MNTLILYATNHGTTEKIAERISRLIGYNRCKTVNINETTPPQLYDFDTVIIGGSIHFGKVQRKIRRYCEDHIDQLLTKKLGLFICYMDKDQEMEEYINSFPAALIQHAHAEGYFGGEFDFDKLNFIERFIVRKNLGHKESITRIDSQSINHFAIMMQEELTIPE
ncbi:MAG: flavodoxin [Cyanothece sp. SIO1E1]|nr:flavodoxin [Cyanothece sp. SIO1E1]